MKKFYLLISAVIILIVTFMSCNGPIENAFSETSVTPASASPSLNVSPTKKPLTPSPSPSATPQPTKYNGPENPLTGLPVDEDLSDVRPVAVMLNNIKEALPQHGTSDADIIYETLAEGGITRMLAVYQDISKAGNIGSIRSARAYYIDLAQGHDALFVHAGGSPQAYDVIYGRDIASIDGVRGYSSIFYRNSDRSSYAYEHTLFSSGSLLSEYIPEYDFRTEHYDDYSYSMSFADDGTPKSGKNAITIDVFFSSYKTGEFEYDSNSGLYMVSEYGDYYVDGNTWEQVGVTNVIVLYTYISDIYGDDAGRIDVDLIGSGSGYFACGGKYIPINWYKDSYSSQFVYTLEDGSTLTLGRGKSYICIIPNGNSVEFS